MNKVKELAAQFGKREAEVKEIIRPMLTELLQFCQSDGGDEALAQFRSSNGGRQFLEAMRRNEEEGT